MAIRELWLATVFGKDMESFLPPKSTSVVIVVSLIGLFSLARKNPIAVAMLTGPSMAAAAASMFHLWPLTNRLLLFATPSVILFTAAGVGQLLRMTPPKAHAASALAVGTLLLALPTLDAIQKTHVPPTFSDTPAAIAELERQRPKGETVYVFARAHVECSFYTGDLETRNPTCTLPNARVLLGRWPPEPRFHSPGEGLVDALSEWAEQESQRILAAAEGRFSLYWRWPADRVRWFGAGPKGWGAGGETRVGRRAANPVSRPVLMQRAVEEFTAMPTACT